MMRLAASFPKMTREIASLAAFGLIIGCSHVYAQSSEEWSLEPRTAPFPCDSVRNTPTGLLFLKPLKIMCNGKAFLTPMAGSSYAVSYACDRTSGIVLLDQVAMRKQENNLLDAIKKDCQH
jgi:hypothetical protein